MIPFAIKNAGATYMRAMTTIFHDMINKVIELCVYDFIIKSSKSLDHLTHLNVCVNTIRSKIMPNVLLGASLQAVGIHSQQKRH